MYLIGIYLVVLVIAIGWMIADFSYEPVIVTLGSTAALIGHFIKEYKIQTDKIEETLDVKKKEEDAPINSPITIDYNNTNLIEVTKIINILFKYKNIDELGFVIRKIKTYDKIISNRFYTRYVNEITYLKNNGLIVIHKNNIPVEFGIPFTLTDTGNITFNILIIITDKTGKNLSYLKRNKLKPSEIINFVLASSEASIKKKLLDIEFILHCKDIVKDSIKAKKMYILKNNKEEYIHNLSDAGLENLGTIMDFNVVDSSVFTHSTLYKYESNTNPTVTCSASMFAFICMLYISERKIQSNSPKFEYTKKYNAISKNTLSHLTDSINEDGFDLYAMADWEIKKLLSNNKKQNEFVVLMNLPNQLHRILVNSESIKYGNIRNNKLILPFDTTAEGGLLRLTDKTNTDFITYHQDIYEINKFVKENEYNLIMWEPFASIFHKNSDYKLLKQPIPHSAYLIAPKVHYSNRQKEYDIIIKSLSRAWYVLEKDKSVISEKVLTDQELTQQITNLYSIMEGFYV